MNPHIIKNRFCSLLVIICSCLACDKEEEQKIPLVEPNLTLKVTYDTPTSLKAEVTIVTLGNTPIKEHGIVWSESPEPTIENKKYVHTSRLTYTYTVTGLVQSTPYYVRAFVLFEDNTILYTQQQSTTTVNLVIESVEPAVVWADQELLIRTRGLDRQSATLYINGVKTNFQVQDAINLQPQDATIKAIVPFGLQVDSLTIAVESTQTRIVYPKKIRYKRGRWVKMKSLSEDPKYVSYYLTGISLLDKGYVIGGQDKSLFQYSPDQNSWSIITQISNSDVSLVRYSLFTIDDYLFFEDRNRNIKVFNVLANQWENFPITERPTNPHSYLKTSFTFNNAGYITMGLTREVWTLSSKSGLNWKRLNDFPGKAQMGASAVTTSDAVYLIGGVTDENEQRPFNAETWKYNPALDSWERKSDYPGKGKVFLTGFSINNKIYVGTGAADIQDNTRAIEPANDFWEFDPSTNKWREVLHFPFNRHSMYAFTIQGKGYVGSGTHLGSIANGDLFDLWKFEID